MLKNSLLTGGGGGQKWPQIKYAFFERPAIGAGELGIDPTKTKTKPERNGTSREALPLDTKQNPDPKNRTMKKRNITLLTAFAAAAAFASSAQAAIVATGEIAGWTHTLDGSGNWDVTGGAGSSRPAGTMSIDNTGTANLVNSTSEHIFLGGGVGGTMTVSGSGAEFRTGSGQFRVGNQGSGELTVTNGGWANVSDRIYLGHSGAGYALVTGAGSKVTAPLIAIGYAPGYDPDTHILTVADGGLVQTDSLRFSFDESGSDVGGYVDMAAGGILAVLGDKTGAGAFASGGLFTKFNAANVGEIQYDAGAGFVNMTGATEGVDYTLALGTGVLTGYTVLTMAAIPEPSSMGLLALSGLALLRRRRA
jgi:T5SS/PEP-CTERM-associated repeat protein